MRITGAVDRDAPLARRLSENHPQRLERLQDRVPLVVLPTGVLRPAHERDEASDVFGMDLIEPAAPEVRDQVILERPVVDLERARSDGLPFEPLARVLLERLPGRLDPCPLLFADA